MKKGKISIHPCAAMIFIMVIVFSSCRKNDFSVSGSGLRYRFVEKKGGDKPKQGDMMRLHIKYKNNKNEVLYDSDILGDAFVLELTPPTFRGGLEEGFAMMGEGDSACFLVSADSVFQKTFMQPLPASIEKGDFLYFDVRMKKVMTAVEFKKESETKEKEVLNEEVYLIEDYLKKNQITVEPVEEGVYLIVFNEGTGIKPVFGDSVELKYTGSFLSGEVFDASSKSGSTLKYLLGDGKRLPAWEKAVASLKEGTRARLVLSSLHAYGKAGLGPVPPDTPVVFDIELLKVSPHHF